MCTVWQARAGARGVTTSQSSPCAPGRAGLLRPTPPQQSLANVKTIESKLVRFVAGQWVDRPSPAQLRKTGQTQLHSALFTGVKWCGYFSRLAISRPSILVC